MGAKRTIQDASLPNSVSLGASDAGTVVSKVFTIQSDGLSIRIAIRAASATKTTGITFKLQTSAMTDDAATPQPVWEDAAGVTADVTETTTDPVVVSIIGNAANADQTAAFPLGLQGRVVCSTGSDDAVVVDSVHVLTPAH